MRRFRISVLRAPPVGHQLTGQPLLGRVLAGRWVRAVCLFGIALSLCSWGLAYYFRTAGNATVGFAADLPGVYLRVIAANGSVHFGAREQSTNTPPALQISPQGGVGKYDWDYLGFALGLRVTPLRGSDYIVPPYVAVSFPNWFLGAVFFFVNAYSKRLCTPEYCSHEGPSLAAQNARVGRDDV